MSYAEAVQLYCEVGKEEWAKFALIAFYICEANRDPKKGPKLKLSDFNPWTREREVTSGVKLDEDFNQLKRLATLWRPK